MSAYQDGKIDEETYLAESAAILKQVKQSADGDLLLDGIHSYINFKYPHLTPPVPFPDYSPSIGPAPSGDAPPKSPKAGGATFPDQIDDERFRSLGTTRKQGRKKP